MKFTKAQRLILWFVSAIGLFGINGLFLYAVFFQSKQMNAAYDNLYAMAFILEAFVLLPLGCFLIWALKLKSPGWLGFLILSLLGSLAFSIPFSILLWSRENKK